MASKDAVIALYRTLLRFGNKLTRKDRVLEFREPLVAEWGYAQRSASGSEYRRLIFQKHLPLLHVPEDPCFSGRELKQFISQQFKDRKACSANEASDMLDLGFKGLRVLLEQNSLDLCSSELETEGVLIEVTSKFNGSAEGFDGKEQFVFTYRIRITNNRAETVQILGREWHFMDAVGREVATVPLDPENGVVGQQPKIPPGGTWEYYSGCPMPTPSGVAKGRLVGVRLGPAPGFERLGWLAPAVPTFSFLPPQLLQKLDNSGSAEWGAPQQEAKD